ncbi:MAG: hypothetical protein LBI28_10760 [Treponema sp.]|nr:hypothetical protein [Treponema sp.]
MIGFLIRKTLYDLWDNMFRIVVLNVGFFICAAIPIFLPKLAGLFIKSTALEMALSALGIFICSIYLATAAITIKPISDYGAIGFADFFRSLKIALPAGIVMGFFVFLVFLIITYIIPFYATMEPFTVGIILASIVFWVTIFALLSFQFYFTVYARLGSKIIKAFKKCMIISLDNTGLAIFLIIHNFFALLISVVFAFMFPGPVGVLLYLDEAIRLRLLKYDWLEANPGANRRKIPWDELLIEERERTGTRTFKNFIFPWKD